MWLLHRLAGCERTWPLPRVVYVFDDAWKCVRARGDCSRCCCRGGVRRRAHVYDPSGGRSVPWGLFRWPRTVHTFPRTPALYCHYNGRMLVRVVHVILPQLSVTEDACWCMVGLEASGGWSVWFRRELPEGLTTYSWPFKEDLRLPMPPTPVAKDVTSRADAGAGPSCAAPWAEAEGAGLAERTL